MIYLDNAATSWPKPPAVIETVRDWLANIGASPGRSAYRTAASSTRIVFDAREALAQLLGIADSRRLLFMSGATFALNTVIYGLLRGGGHCITTSMEHNSVMRPLRRLAEEAGAEVQVIPSDSQGRANVGAIAAAIKPAICPTRSAWPRVYESRAASALAIEDTVAMVLRRTCWFISSSSLISISR